MQWMKRHEVWTKVHVDCERMVVLMTVLFVVKVENDCLFAVKLGK